MTNTLAAHRSILVHDGIHRFRVGDFTAAVVSDGSMSVHPARPLLAANATDEDFAAAMEAHGDDPVTTELASQILFLDTGHERILFDVGSGSTMGARLGLALANLEAAGITADSIDLILLTHAHRDHFFAITDDQVRHPTYPNARVVIGDVERRFWLSAIEFASTTLPAEVIRMQIDGARSRLLALADRMTTVRDGDVVVPGVTARAAFGHTPGHLVYEVVSGRDHLIVLGDVAHHPAVGIDHPNWHPAYDQDPVRAIETRQRIWEMAATGNTLVTASHFPFPGVGRIQRAGQGFRWIAGI